LRSIAEARCFRDSAFALRYADLRSFASKKSQTVENDRERIVPFTSGQIQRSLDQLCLMRPLTGAEMDFDDDDIGLLLRLKHDEQPPASSYENFLSEFRRRQRDQLLRQPLLSICPDRAQNFVLRLDGRSLAPYPAAIAAVLVCGAVVSIRIYQQPDTTQFAVENSPVPSTPLANAEREFNLAPPAMPRTFNTEPILLPRNRDVLVLPVDALDSEEFIPLTSNGKHSTIIRC